MGIEEVKKLIKNKPGIKQSEILKSCIGRPGASILKLVRDKEVYREKRHNNYVLYPIEKGEIIWEK